MAISWGKAVVEATTYVVGVGVLGAVVGTLIALYLMVVSRDPPIAPAPQVQAFATVLRSAPGLASLEQEPRLCRRWGKGGKPYVTCRYRAGDIEAKIIWTFRTERLLGVELVQGEPLGGLPFSWTDLAQVLRMMCRDIALQEADELVATALAKLNESTWEKLENAVPAVESEPGANRQVTIKQSPGCRVQLKQRVERHAVRSTLEAQPFNPGLPD